MRATNNEWRVCSTFSGYFQVYLICGFFFVFFFVGNLLFAHHSLWCLLSVPCVPGSRLPNTFISIRSLMLWNSDVLKSNRDRKRKKKKRKTITFKCFYYVLRTTFWYIWLRFSINYGATCHFSSLKHQILNVFFHFTDWSRNRVSLPCQIRNEFHFLIRFEKCKAKIGVCQADNPNRKSNAKLFLLWKKGNRWNFLYRIHFQNWFSRITNKKFRKISIFLLVRCAHIVTTNIDTISVRHDHTRSDTSA